MSTDTPSDHPIDDPASEPTGDEPTPGAWSAPAHDTRWVPPSTRTRERRRGRRTSPELLAAIVAGSAVLGILSDASPTGNPWGDALWNGLFAAGLSYATAHAKRWTWFLLAGTAAAVAVAQGTLALVFGAASLLGAFLVRFVISRHRWNGAIVGGLAAQALLRGDSYGFTGLPTLVVAAACAPLLVSGYRLSPRRTRKFVRIMLVAAAAIIVPIGLYSTIIALRAEDRLLGAIDLTDEAIDAVNDGDEGLAQSLLITSGNQLDDVAVQFDRPWILPARLVPVLGQHTSAVHSLADAGADATYSAADAIARLDADALKREGGAIDLVELRALVDSLHRLFDAVDRAEQQVAGIDRTWLIPKATQRIELVDEKLTGRFGDTTAADAAIEVVPALLGADGPRRYLVMFMTPAESRALGGFAGNWAELAADDGELSLVDSGRGDEINDAQPAPGVYLPSELRDLYQGWKLTTTFQNLPVIPDLPTMADIAADQFELAFGRRPDGVFTIDPAGMAGLVSLSGPVTVDGRTLNAAEVEQFVLRDQYIDYEGDDEGRLAALDELTRQVFDQFVGGDLPSPRRLVDVLEPLAQQDHIRLTMFDDTEATALLGVGLGEPFPFDEGQDLLAVVTQNSGENKIDTFLERTLEYAATIDPATGEITAELTITLHNSAPAEGLPDAIIGNNGQQFPFGTNRLRLNVYTPHALQAATVAGFEAELIEETELGWNRYRTTLFVGSGETLVVTLDLAGRLDLSDGYVLDIEHQPMVNPDRVELDLRPAPGATLAATSGVDAEGRATFTLDSDNVVGLVFDN